MLERLTSDFMDMAPKRILRRVAAVGWLLSMAGLPVITSAAVVINGPSQSFEIQTNAAGNESFLFTLEPDGTFTGRVEVVPFAPDVVRVRYHFVGLFDREEVAIDKTYSEWPSIAMTWTNQGNTNLVIETDDLLIDIVLSNRFQIHFRDKTGFPLLRDLQMEYDADYTQIDDTNGYAQVFWDGESTGISNYPSGFKLKSIKVLASNEVFFGLGDLGGPLNRRDRKVQFWTQDSYQFGESRNPRYTALPMVYGLNGASSNHPPYVYGLFFNNPARPVFEMFSGLGDTWSFQAGDDQLDYFFFGGGTNHVMPAVINRFSELTGRPTMLPKWALGYHQSRHSYFSQQRVVDLIREFRTNDFPVDAMYLDIGVQDKVNDQPAQFSFNPDYTNVAALTALAESNGVKLIPLIEPLLTTNDPLYPEANTNLFFIKNRDLSTYVGTNFLGDISWIDFSITAAAGWWRGKVEAFIMSNGFDAVWNDLNEPNENAMPLDTLWFLDGRYGGGLVTNDTRKWTAVNRNTFSIWQASNSWQAMRNVNPGKRPFVLSRSAWPGIQKYAVGWSGDNKSTYDHLRFNIPMGLNVMLSGQANFGHDVGGFVGDADADLLARWIQWGSLTPYFRNHNDNNPSNQEPWIDGGTFTEWNRRWIKFRYEIMPYLYTLMEQSTTNGTPINVPTAFHFNSDSNTFYLNDYDFMVGKDLITAPVYEANTNRRTVYLPFGAFWYNWDDGLRYDGGNTYTVPASQGTLPLFSRDGAIIPMGPVQQYANEFVPDYLDIHHWPGADNVFTLYEDDGETTNYLSGDAARTRFSTQSSSNYLALTIAARDGDYDPGNRSFYFRMHDAGDVLGVTVNGQAVERFANRSELEQFATNGWAYNRGRRELTVALPDDGSLKSVEGVFRSEVDTDGDGMPDWWEVLFSGGSTNLDASGDGDVDGRSNLDEFREGRNPLVADVYATSYTNITVAGTFNYWNEATRNLSLVADHTWAGTFELSGWTNIEFKFVANGDWSLMNWGDLAQTNESVPIHDVADVSGFNMSVTGLMDGIYSIRFNETGLSYRIVSAAGVDDDGDGIDNHTEFRFGFDPMSSVDAAYDSDGDGLAVSNEFLAGGSPLRSDTDGDGVPDLDEFIAGTLLSNSTDYLALYVTDAASGVFNLQWTAVTGRAYDVSSRPGLINGNWSLLIPYTNITGSGLQQLSVTSDAPVRAYRLHVVKP